MFHRDLVALGAGQFGVMGNEFFIGNTPVTSAAIFRSMRQSRIVGIMASHAGLAGIMHICQNLRKTRRPRRIIAVADGAIVPPAGCEKFVFIWRLNMHVTGAMAGLASYPPVERVGLG